MSSLREYLAQKRAAYHLLQARDTDQIAPKRLRADATAEGRSGVRRIRIRHHQILSDSPADFAGYDLGPASPEIQLGVLSSCLTHIYLIQAADRQVPLDAIDVTVEATQDPRAGRPGFEDVPFHPHDIEYTVRLRSSASRDEIDALHAAVEARCPILALLSRPQQITGKVILNEGEAIAA